MGLSKGSDLMGRGGCQGFRPDPKPPKCLRAKTGHGVIRLAAMLRIRDFLFAAASAATVSSWP
mgnify:CR=1 FL=1